MLVDLNEKCSEWLFKMAMEQGTDVTTIVEILIDSYVKSCEEQN